MKVRVVYSRVTPFGFINLENASDEDRFYGEEIEIEEGDFALELAEKARALFEDANRIQRFGLDPLSQAEDMRDLLFAYADGLVE